VCAPRITKPRVLAPGRALCIPTRARLLSAIAAAGKLLSRLKYTLHNGAVTYRIG
jgi:hypothetical protein